MTRLARTDSENPDFATLVRLLDAYLAVMDGDEHSFYDQFNKIVNLKFVVVAYTEGKPVGCGAIKPYGDAMEVKRMYVDPEYRGKGIAQEILGELEKWAREFSFTKCILETGKRQTEAVRLYQKSGYISIPNYGQYKEVENSLCFEKTL